MARDVFLSHSSTDATLTAALCRRLEEVGISCWMAPRDIVPGMAWSRSIIAGLDECAVTLLVLTSRSNASEHVLNELEIGHRHGRPIFAFRIEECECDPLIDNLADSANAVDFHASDTRFEELVAKLKAYLTHYRSKPRTLITAECELNVYADGVYQGRVMPGEEFILFLPAEGDKTIELCTPDVSCGRKWRRGELADRLHITYESLVDYCRKAELDTLDNYCRRGAAVEGAFNDGIAFFELPSGDCGEERWLVNRYGEKVLRLPERCHYDFHTGGFIVLSRYRGNDFSSKVYRLYRLPALERVPGEYSFVWYAQGGLLPVQQGELWGLIDSEGKIVVEPSYADYPVLPGAIEIEGEKGHKYYAHADGSEAFPGRYFHEALSFTPQGIAWVSDAEGQYLIDRSGAIVAYGDRIDPFCEPTFASGFYTIERQGKSGLLYPWGKVCIEPRYDSLFVLRGARAVGQSGSDCDILDIYGKVVKRLEGCRVIPYGRSHLFAAYEKLGSGLHGLVRLADGESVTEALFTDIDFDDYYIHVCKDGLEGLIDYSGAPFLPCVAKRCRELRGKGIVEISIGAHKISLQRDGSPAGRSMSFAEGDSDDSHNREAFDLWFEKFSHLREAFATAPLREFADANTRAYEAMQAEALSDPI